MHLQSNVLLYFEPSWLPRGHQGSSPLLGVHQGDVKEKEDKLTLTARKDWTKTNIITRKTEPHARHVDYFYFDLVLLRECIACSMQYAIGPPPRKRRRRFRGLGLGEALLQSQLRINSRRAAVMASSSRGRNAAPPTWMTWMT